MAHDSRPNTTILPLTIITVVDLGRLKRELENLDDFSYQNSVRAPGSQPELPRTSRSLGEFAQQFELNLLVEQDRIALKNMLDLLKKSAPVIHISFASDPSPVFLTKLITWLRSEIHPTVLLSIGLQPGIAAGCIVRTTNKYFDFSLRKYLDEKNKLLTDALKETAAS